MFIFLPFFGGSDGTSMSYIYIAHAQEDLDALLQVHEALRRDGITDKYDPEASDTLFDESALNETIMDALAVLVIVSQDSIRSKRIRTLLTFARMRGIPIIPYRIDKARLGSLLKTMLHQSEPIHASDERALDLLVETTKKAYKRVCPVVSIMNMKGGVGKTTLAAQIFGTLQAETAGRILLIDLDPQYNLSQTFFDMEVVDESAAADRSVISLFEVSRLNGTRARSPAENWQEISTEPFNPPPRGALTHRILEGSKHPGRLDLISGQFEISKYAFASSPETLSEVQANFLRILDHYRSNYDLIVFDTNPNASFLSQCAFAAADRVIAPMHPDQYSLRGVRLLSEVMATQIPEPQRPQLSVLFNAVRSSEQTNFEADARNGALNHLVGFDLAGALFEHVVPNSRHLAISKDLSEKPAYDRLLAHHGHGGGLGKIRTALKNVATEISRSLQA